MPQRTTQSVRMIHGSAALSTSVLLVVQLCRWSWVTSLQSGVENPLWLPDAEEDDEDDHADDRSGDVDQPGAVVCGDEELGRAEGDAGDEDGGPDLQHCTEACEGPDEPEGNDDAERGKDAADDSRE